jgi:flagellar biosynthesis protein FlhB
MADKNDGGDKTEKPTPKRLEDARKKGDVSKSKEVSSAVGLALWLTLGAMVVGYAVARLSALFESLFVVGGPGRSATR